MHRLLTFLTLTLTLTLPAIGTAQQAPAASPLPYVYTEWRQYTVADGLPNDHIFTVKADGHWIWIGTEGGLARLDKRSGKIDHAVAAYWREHYDLAHIIHRDWAELGPKLKGKIHVYCGTMDNFYLNNAVYLLQEVLEGTTDPYYAGEVDYGDRAEHCWNGDHEQPIHISRLRYNLFYYVYVLSFYDRATDDQRYLEAARLLESKLDARGRVVVERPNRKLADLSFCAAGRPSDRCRSWGGPPLSLPRRGTAPPSRAAGPTGSPQPRASPPGARGARSARVSSGWRGSPWWPGRRCARRSHRRRRAPSPSSSASCSPCCATSSRRPR